MRHFITLLLFALTAVAASAQTVVTYTPSDEIIANPERGYFTHHEFYSDRSEEFDLDQLDAMRAEGRTLVFTVFVMRDFRNKEISKPYLNRVNRTLRALRRCGMKAIVRFCYSYSEDDHPWDAPWDVTRRHIEQLTPILRENSDVIAVLEAGFIGVWGEWYYTDNYNFQPKADEYGPRRQVLDALLDMMPSDRFVAVRYPAAKLLTYDMQHTDTISALAAYDGSRMSRVSFHNDCFLANEDDMGTFYDIPENRQFWLWDTRYVPMGGETCALSPCCEVPNALKDFAAYHWSYLNKDYHLDVLAKWDRERAPGSGEPFSDVIKKRLGYRFVLERATFTDQPHAGQPFTVTFDVRNDGWASPFNPRGVEIILRHGKTQHVFPVTADPRRWFSGTTQHVETTFSLPADMKSGEWEVCLNLPDGAPTLHDNPLYSIQLANKGVWRKSTGYNLLTKIKL